AKIALQAPERGDDRGRHAEVLVFARKYRLVLFHLCGAIGQTSACEHLVGHLQEIRRKECRPAVDVDDALVEHQVRRSRSNGGMRNAFRSRLFLEFGKPRLETGAISGAWPAP